MRNVYHGWRDEVSVQQPFAFAAYNAALDREEHAARRYAPLTNRAGRLRANALKHQVAQIEVTPWGW